MDSLVAFARKKLAEIKAKGLLRQAAPGARGAGMTVTREGETFVSFCDNDYLGLSHHPGVIAAAKKATDEYGAGAGASRLITGDHPLYRELEEKIAAFKQAEAALVFGSGYLTNLGVIPALAREGDLILPDRLCHACIFGGAQLSRAATKVFRHNDLDHLRELLEGSRKRARHALIVTDGVFSMEGDRAPVEALAALARKFDAWLMVDDAHGLGVVEGGRGATFAGGRRLDVPLQMGTFSKACGSYGGYLAADRPVIEFVRNRARSLIYTTGLPPAVVAASLKALEIIASDSKLCAEPMRKAALFCDKLGLPAPESAIVPIIAGEPEIAVRASEKLAREGFLVSPVRPPTVPEGTSRLRFAFSAAHASKDVERLAAAVRQTGIVK